MYRYRFAGADDLKDIELISQELAAQAQGEILSVTPAPPGKRNGAIVTKTKRKPSEELLAGVDTSRNSSIVEEDDDITIFRPKHDNANGNARTSNGNKKMRLGDLNDQTIAVISTSSVSELKATTIALQDRARITSDALLDCQRSNAKLESKVKMLEDL